MEYSDMLFFRRNLISSKRPQVPVLLDQEPHPLASLLNEVFENPRDPRVRFFIEKIGVTHLQSLLQLRQAALKCDAFDHQFGTKIKPNQYSILRRWVTYSSSDDSSSDTYTYDNEHTVTAMIDIFFSNQDRDRKFENNPLVKEQLLKLGKKAEVSALFLRLMFFMTITAGFSIWYTNDEKDKFTKDVKAFSQVALFVFFFATMASLKSRDNKINRILTNALFTDARYDELLNQLCEKANIQPLDWSQEVKVNSKSCTVKTLALLLLLSFNDRMVDVLFSEILPKIREGETFDLVDKTDSRPLTMHFEPKKTHGMAYGVTS